MKFFQLAQRRKAQFKPFDRFKQTDITEVARSASRKQQQPQVCRRRAMGDDRAWVFLEIIGRQPMVGIPNKSFKETPGAPRNQTHRLPPFTTQFTAGFLERTPGAADKVSE